VNDAFGSWQPHVSTLGVAKFLPSYAGLLMQRECEARSIHWFPYDRVGVVNADP
jgi:phosphoglycerate kinase